MIKNFLLCGILVAFAFTMSGCMSFPVYYYNLGNVSEENCAFIVLGVNSSVSSELQQAAGIVEKTKEGNVAVAKGVSVDTSSIKKAMQTDYPIEKSYMGINGQRMSLRDYSLPEPGFVAIRVKPGSYTFTVYFKFEEKAIPVSIKYDCKAGVAYSFNLAVLNIVGGGVAAEISIEEKKPESIGKMSMISISSLNTVDSKIEKFSVDDLKKFK